VFDAPQELVFQAWTDPQHMPRWYGPNGFTITLHESDLRVGGVCRFTMHGPDGTDYPNWIEWLEILPPELIVYRQGTRADDPNAFVSTVTITDLGDRSEIELRTVFNTKEQRDEVVERYGAVKGAEQTLARLGEWVSTVTEPTNQRREAK
jgi:uncharacterized protein YndB with AHSA1/START domain